MGVVVCSATCFYALKPLLSLFVSSVAVARDAPLTVAFFPLQTTVGFVLGFCLYARGGAFGKSKQARFTWIIPALWFLLIFSVWRSRSLLAETRLEHFFLSSNYGSKRDQFVTTLPLLTATAYSLANRLAFMLQVGAKS